MATRTQRQPLMNIPNGTNSPRHLLTNSGSKRTRAVANIAQQENNEPPSKRQALEKPTVPFTPRGRAQKNAEGQVFERGRDVVEQNDFNKKLLAARDRTASRASDRTQKEEAGPATKTKVEDVKQWQKHYRKLFPSYSFYFDSVPEDLKGQFRRRVTTLGAKEEKFFSKNVTHLVTSREVPDKLKDAVRCGMPERYGLRANDIIYKAAEYDLKIWTAEKLSRMLATLLEERSTHDHAARTRNNPDELEQVLKNDKLAGREDRSVFPAELVVFRGPFIYVHDMDEKVRPIMVREYPRVAKRTDGEWPQFRSAAVGKCPFVEDPNMKKELEQERQRQKAALQQQQYMEAQQRQRLTRTNSNIILQNATMNPPKRTSPRKALRDVPAPNIVPSQPVQQTEDKPTNHERNSSFPPMPAQPPHEFVKPSQMTIAREPAASGIVKSMMTSAIQSQMITSGTATGIKAGTSKEVNELKRKVLERTHTGSLSIGSAPSSHPMNNLTAVIKNARAPAPARAAKAKAQEKLGGIQEEADPYAEEVLAERAQLAAQRKKAKPAAREPKPGYCENCHDKYDDFEDHIVSRKHRKFAATASNWTELDALLAQLQDDD